MDIKFNYSKLKGKIVEVYDTLDAFSKTIEMDRATLSSKLNNKTYFTQPQMLEMCDRLNIPINEIPVYFFTVTVEKTQHGGGDESVRETAKDDS